MTNIDKCIDHRRAVMNVYSNAIDKVRGETDAAIKPYARELRDSYSASKTGHERAITEKTNALEVPDERVDASKSGSGWSTCAMFQTVTEGADRRACPVTAPSTQPRMVIGEHIDRAMARCLLSRVGMKKVTKRTKLLELKIETIRNLSGAELVIAAGGGTYAACNPTLAGCGGGGRTGTV